MNSSVEPVIYFGNARYEPVSRVLEIDGRSTRLEPRLRAWEEVTQKYLELPPDPRDRSGKGFGSGCG